MSSLKNLDQDESLISAIVVLSGLQYVHTRTHARTHTDSRTVSYPYLLDVLANLSTVGS